jgi:hypothetical protein
LDTTLTEAAASATKEERGAARQRPAQNERRRRPRKLVSKVVVAGDICIDWLAFPVPALDPVETKGKFPPNYRLDTGTLMVARPGGALLLARLVKAAATVAQEAAPVTVRSQKLRGGLTVIPPAKVIHSIIQLGLYPAQKGEAEADVYRVKSFAGFAGPSSGLPPRHPVFEDVADAGMVILDDSGNGYRDDPDIWPEAVREGKRPIVILKMSRPLCRGDLWKRVQKDHPARLIVVVSADDLRAEGLKISRELSWERTATDFAWQMASSPEPVVQELATVPNLIVRFGIEGAIHYRGGSQEPTCLYYDPTVAENGLVDRYPGKMSGFASAFVAALAARVSSEDPDADDVRGIPDGIRDGLRSSRALFRLGFGRHDPEIEYPSVDYPGAEIFTAEKDGDRTIADIDVPKPSPTRDPNREFWRWSILKDLSEAGLEEVASKIVREGESAALKQVPIAEFGALKTADRAEIESLRSISNLIRGYLKNKKPGRPLSIAVFGPPGAGKSFYVTEVAQTAGEDVERRQFNVAQFNSSGDLTRAFHQVRDVGLEGKVPLIFFDEFDCEFEGNRLGWLKYFLTAMQDGEFRDGDVVHPIGKAIFVFAGGISPTFAAFSREAAPKTEPEDAERPAQQDVTESKPNQSDPQQDFKDAKGPDFASRLRGYVNILGPDPTDRHDRFFLIRRAMLLRSQLKRNPNSKHLFDSQGRAQIDEGVLRAFLGVGKFKHGARSIEAIIDMSMLHDRRSFEQASLPPAKQLALHVDADEFSQLVARDVLFREEREKIARAIHEKYLRDQKNNKPPGHSSMRPWKALDEELKESNRRQADDIPKKLRAIGCGFRPAVGRKPVEITFNEEEEIEPLAEAEHERWFDEKTGDGWTQGTPRNDKKKIHPDLLPWENLPRNVQEYDRDTVRGIPEFMADAGFEIYRLS